MEGLAPFLENQKAWVDLQTHKFRQLASLMGCTSADFPLAARAQSFEICLHLARDATNRDQLRENGVVPSLFHALQACYSVEITRMASQSLVFMSENDKSRDSIRSENGLKLICNTFRTSEDVPTQDLLLATLTTLCTNHPATVEQVVVGEKMVPVLASLLVHAQLQQRSLFALAKLAASSNALREAKPSGLITNLVKLVAISKLRDNALILLFNLSQLDINREEIASQVSTPLTSFVSAATAPIEAATWQRILQLLYNVSVDGGARVKIRESGLLSHVVNSLANPNAQLVNLAAGTLASYNAPEEAELLSKHHALVGLLDAWKKHEALRPSLLLTLANILAYEPNQEQFVELQGGAVIAAALTLPSAAAKAAAARAVSNVSAVHDFVRSHLCDSGVVAALVPLLRTASEADVRRQVARALTNLALSQKVGEELVRLGAIEQVVTVLQAPEIAGDAPTKARFASVLVNTSASVPSSRNRMRKCGVVPLALSWLTSSSATDLQTAAAKLLMNLTVSGLVRKDIVTSGSLKAELERVAQSNSAATIAEILHQVLRNLSFPYEQDEVEKEENVSKAAEESRLEELKKEAERKRLEAELAEKQRIGEEEFRRKQEEAERQRRQEEERQREAAALAEKIAAQQRAEAAEEAARLAEALALEKLMERARILEEQERLLKMAAAVPSTPLASTPSLPPPSTPSLPPHVELPQPAPVETPQVVSESVKPVSVTAHVEATPISTPPSVPVVAETPSTPPKEVPPSLPQAPVEQPTQVEAPPTPPPPHVPEASVPQVPPAHTLAVVTPSLPPTATPTSSLPAAAVTPVTEAPPSPPPVVLPSQMTNEQLMAALAERRRQLQELAPEPPVTQTPQQQAPIATIAPAQLSNEQLAAALAERRRQLEELKAERQRVEAEVKAAQDKKKAAKDLAREQKKKRKEEQAALEAQKKRQEEEAARLQQEAQAKLKADATARAAAQEVRTRIAQELHDTERNYVKQLQLLIKKYQEPWQALEGTKQALCSKEQLRIIFTNTASLYNLHQLLLEAISSRVVRDWNENTKIGDIFLKFIDMLSIYSEYINGYDEAHRVVKELLETSIPFAKFCRRAELDPESSHMDLESLLITPVQRMPRYEMLLSTLYKNTWQGHPDYDSLFEAKLKMKECVDNVNEKKRRFEETQRLFSVMRSLTGSKFDSGELFGPGRRVVKEGDVKFSASASRTKPGHYFLLNDTLLLTSIKKKKTASSYKYKGHISLFSIKAEESEKHLLNVTDTAKGYSKLLAFDNTEERSKFHFMIKDAIKQLFTRPSSQRLTVRTSVKPHP